MKCAAIALILPFLCCCDAQAAGPSTRPNILFILIDDMGYGDLGCYGGTRVGTPEIDRLAREGIRFTQFYVNAPICSPSRVAFLTGQYPKRWKITSYLDSRKINKDRGMENWLAPTAPSLARILQDAGYYTSHVGKWHMGGQRDVDDAPMITSYGFERSLTSFEGLGERVLPQFPMLGGKPFKHSPTISNAAVGKGPIHWVPRDKVTATYVDRAIEEMDVAAKSQRPFYVNLWLDDVHSPNFPSERSRGNGSRESMYLDVVKETDEQLGRVFEHVRSKPELQDNTIILLASDNGPEEGLGSAGGLRGTKGMLYEGGIREPLIVWGQKPVSRSVDDTTVIAGMDFLPTVCRLAHVKVPEDANPDGLDMSAAMLGKMSVKRESPVMWIRPPDRPGPDKSWPDLAIREDKWKLLVMRDGTEAELFDVLSEPNEKKNLADEHAEVVARLSKHVIEWDRAIK